MRRIATMVHLLLGVFLLAIVAFPTLNDLQLASEAEECARRRAAIQAHRLVVEHERVCPRDNIPYLFELASDTSVIARCQNGHDQKPLPLHKWVSIR